MSYVFLPLARRAYVDILWWYELNAGSEIADMMRDRFNRAFMRIETGRLMGARRLDWLPDPWRFSLVDPYWVIWRRDSADEVTIGHLLHARRDVARLLTVLR